MSIDVAGATLIGSGLSFIGGLFTNALNKAIADDNVQLLKEMNDHNIAFQKHENDITRQREDNAVQRAAADMTAAGLSKTLAAGNPASAQALQAPQVSEAPTNSFRYESALQKMNIVQVLQSMAEKQKQLDMADDKNKAEIDYINEQTKALEFDNVHKMETFQAEMALKNAQAFQFSTQGFLNQNNAKIADITSRYTAQKIESEINLNVVSELQKRADVLKTKADITMIGKQIKAMSYDIAQKVMQTKGLYLDNLKKKGELKLLVADRAKVLLENEVLKHNLNYGQKYNYPVGVSPSGLIGGAYGTGLSIGSRINSLNVPGVSTDNGQFYFNFDGRRYSAPDLTAYLNSINGLNY